MQQLTHLVSFAVYLFSLSAFHYQAAIPSVQSMPSLVMLSLWVLGSGQQRGDGALVSRLRGGHPSVWATLPSSLLTSSTRGAIDSAVRKARLVQAIVAMHS